MKGGGSSTDKKEIGKKRMKERKKLRFIGFQWKKNGGEKSFVNVSLFFESSCFEPSCSADCRGRRVCGCVLCVPRL